MKNISSLLMESIVGSYDALNVISYIILAVMALCAVAAIICVLIQPSKSSGIGAAFGGSTDTFYGKNKGKSKESFLKMLTVIFLCILAVLSVVFFVMKLWLANA